jgi:hypothetical protein
MEIQMFHKPAHLDTEHPAGQAFPGAIAATAELEQAIGPDFKLCDHGTIVRLFPLTDAARQWCTEHIEGAEYTCEFEVYANHSCNPVNADHRCAQAIVDGIIADGLTIAHV